MTDMSEQAPAIDLSVAPPPRRVTRVESLMLGAGARLDRFVMQRYLRRNAFPAPGDGDALRARLTRARIFYGDPEFVAKPEAFFTAPPPARADVCHLSKLDGGEVLDVRYTTDFAPVFPDADPALAT